MPIHNEFEDAKNIRPWKDDRESKAVQKIEQYWERLRGSRLLPSRSEVDPRELEGVLGNAFILERIAPGLARFRIAGSHIVEFTGLELRQMPASVLFGIHSRQVLAEAMEAVFDEPAAVFMQLTSGGGFAQKALQGEMVLLPLRSDTGEVSRVLGGIAMQAAVGGKPRRLEITRQSRKTLTGFAGPGQGGPKPRVISRSPNPVPSERPTSAHLRLVVSNDE
ncbi:MAG: PAS domain-containing protein [Silicimonas sp.]|nr:PAS domain-containing protein [Silicimonas sp.]